MATTTFFDVEPIERFKGVSAAIRRPKEITSFSFDDNHQYRWDDSSLRVYYPPTLPVDLCQGFESFRSLDDTRDDHLDGLVDTLALHEREQGKRTVTDIVTWRGMMTKILTTPFANSESWEMNATCFRDTIFIEENHGFKLDSKEKQNRQRMPPGSHSQEMMSYWGYKFETLSLLPDSWDDTPREYIEAREVQTVDNHAQYCSIVRTGFGKIKMVIGGEVDAVWDRKPPPTTTTNTTSTTTPSSQSVTYVELKTAALPSTAPPANPRFAHHPDKIKFERKLLKFWAQSFLLGVPKIIVGFRTREGVLVQLQEFETQEIPTIVGGSTGLWDGNVCVNFAEGFLTWLKSVVVGEGVWRIRKGAKEGRIEVWKVEEEGVGAILSKDFRDWRNETP